MMTDIQKAQFDNFGCASRCLITLANIKGANLTPDTFVEKYFARYWTNSVQCGILPTPKEIKEVAIDLGLARAIGETKDFEEVRKNIGESALSGLLAITRKRKEPDGTYSIYNHCTLVLHTDCNASALIYLESDCATSGGPKGQFRPDEEILLCVPTFLLFLP